MMGLIFAFWVGALTPPALLLLALKVRLVRHVNIEIHDEVLGLCFDKHDLLTWGLDIGRFRILASRHLLSTKWLTVTRVMGEAA